ncbi:MAG: hypothetical protein RLP15_04515 [Cryomorphaceae bacterium]
MNSIKSFFFVILLITSLSLQAQDAGTVDGVITWTDGTQTETSIFVPMTSRSFYPIDMAFFQEKGVRYLDESGDHRLITQDRLDYFEFTFQDSLYLIKYAEKTYNGISTLMRVVINGKVQLLEHHYLKESANGIEMREVRYYLCMPDRDGSASTSIIKMNFKKSCLAFFADYPDMLQKINDKEFKYKSIKKMVRYFNAEHG